ncbi:virulence associated protein [Neisseria meningitidis]|uniref:autotransporter outer membrane beta-barrel domain-containing protein n=1 Tax=Neisseria meningitidis TaxID=487 RepID=UPI0007668340|nr:autotransporter outer membrane beta-barrel domain-containing protein [Neisseria meningitidis]CWP06534.1 virulence associated protein [Neisseria meningitidis]CWP58630.1 virulence associated protein [Neisseria meningitidis]CWP71433.1 virulence associated protein [Neisseria meningitidis]CWP74099.1 virulence associated protein [Neisseria meningitidis]CWP98466.1 virulence associated protein [Neisseria meningitidis]
MAVDYVYDKTKLTDDEITRLKKLRDRNSEYWKDDLFRIDIPKETGLRHDIEGAAKGNFSYPIFYIPTDDKPIDPDKKISFFDSPYTPGYTAAFVQGFGVKERNGYTEEQAKKYIDELRTKLKTAPIIAAAQLGYFQLNDGSGDSWLYNYYRNDIFNSYGEIKHSNINSEILAVGNVADLYYKHFIRNPFIYVDWSIFSLPLPRLKVSENSHVIGQIIHLYRLDLEDSLWEPRWDSDVSYLNLFNSHIRFNTKNDSLIVGESRIRPTPDNALNTEKYLKSQFSDTGYHSDIGNNYIHFAYDLSEREADKPVLTLKSKVKGKTAIVFEEKALNNLKNLTYRQLIKTETDVEPNAFYLLEEYKKGRYRLFLRQCPNGFCIGVEKLAIPTHLVASYAQQAQAANTLFSLRLNDKNSDIFDRTLPRKGLWLRVIDGHSNQWVQGKTAPVEGYRKGVQLGGEVFTWQNKSNQLSIGLMVGQAEQRSTFRNPDTDNLTTGNVKGFGAGVYATWHQLQDKQTGAYADSWVQYQRFRHRINTEDATERFTSKGITASIEAGYNALLAEHFTKKGNSLRVYLQPQAQLTYLGVNGKFSDSENAHVNLLGSRQLQTRVGVQAKAQFSLYKNIAIEPFAAVNALYHNKPFGVEIDGERRVINNKTAIESQLGVAVKIKSHLTLQASFNRQTSKYHQAKQGALNLQWTF